MGLPDKYNECLKTYPAGLHTYPEQYCLAQYLSSLYATLGPGQKKLDFPGRIRVWWHREGFWRTALPQRDAPSDQSERLVFDNLYSTLCYPSSDLIGHGNKQYHIDMLEPYQSVQCNITRVLDAVEGRNPRCRWLSDTAELALLRKHCQWRSPACSNDKVISQSQSQSQAPENICLYVPSSNSTDTWIRNSACKSSANTVAYVEGGLAS